MGVCTRDEGSSELGPFLPHIADCITSAWKDLDEMPPQLRVDISARCRAAFLNDRLLVHARRILAPLKGITFLRGRGGLTLIAIGNSFLLRFKKLRENLSTSNIPTQQSIAFSEQHSLELPGMPPRLTHVNAGYVLNRMQTEIASAHITCPTGKQLVWSIDLLGTASAEIVPFAHEAHAPAKQGTTTRVRSRGHAQRDRTLRMVGGDDDERGS